MSSAVAVAAAAALLVPRVSAQEPGRLHVFEGEVRDAGTGGPLAGAQVSVVGRDARAVTRGDGSFHLTGMAAGVYTLRADRLGYRAPPHRSPWGFRALAGRRPSRRKS